MGMAIVEAGSEGVTGSPISNGFLGRGGAGGAGGIDRAGGCCEAAFINSETGIAIVCDVGEGA
jgi:hypothetical protein